MSDKALGEFRPPYATPAELFPDELAKRRLDLAALLRHHIELVKRFLGAASGDIYTIDFVLAGVAQRSYHILDGFLATYDRWNVYAAAPLVRLQIDNLIRLAYLGRAPNAAEVSLAIMKGQSFRMFRDVDGKRLTDARLVQLCADLYPWLPKVYEKSNEWVHLSPQVISHVYRLKEGARFIIEVPMDSARIPINFLIELLAVMERSTEDVFGWFETWASVKGKGTPAQNDSEAGSSEEPNVDKGVGDSPIE